MPPLISHVQYRVDDRTAHPAQGWREAIVTGHDEAGSLALGVFLLPHDTYPRRQHIELIGHVWEGTENGCWRYPPTSSS